MAFSHPQVSCTKALLAKIEDAGLRAESLVSIAALASALQRDGFGSEEICQAFQELVDGQYLEGPISLYARIIPRGPNSQVAR